MSNPNSVKGLRQNRCRRTRVLPRKPAPTVPASSTAVSRPEKSHGISEPPPGLHICTTIYRFQLGPFREAVGLGYASQAPYLLPGVLPSPPESPTCPVCSPPSPSHIASDPEQVSRALNPSRASPSAPGLASGPWAGPKTSPQQRAYGRQPSAFPSPPRP